MKTVRALCLGLAAAGLSACQGDVAAAAAVQKRERDQRVARLTSRLADSASTDSTPLARWILPIDLAEISGLVLTSDERLVAHDDEGGRIRVIDPRSGFVVKAFQLKGKDAQGDFEGITQVDSLFYMVTSRGKIFTFREGENDQKVPFTVFDTRLGKECEFEGITYDPEHAQLVLPCKRPGDRQLRDQVIIYRVSVPLGESTPEFRAIPIDAFRATHPWKELHPTDIVRDSVTGHFIMVAAPEKALIELSATGEVLRAMPLPRGHVQPEGVAITRDRVLIISDEAQEGPAFITLYRWPLPTRRDSLP